MGIHVFVDQVGYPTGVGKNAMVVGCSRPLGFLVVDADSSKTVFQGKLSPAQWDDASGDSVRMANFSHLRRVGRYYIKVVSAMGFTLSRSACFRVLDHPYRNMQNTTLESFYFARCGCALPKELAGVYSRRSCHTGRAFTVSGGESRDVSGGWHETGDYGRDVVTGSVALGHLLNAWLAFPEQFGDSFQFKEPLSDSELEAEGSFTMPEVLVESRWELEWLLKMQDKDGGVFQRVAPSDLSEPVMPHMDQGPMYIYDKTAVASASFTAAMALASRVYAPFDVAFAQRLEKAALFGWEWLSRCGLSSLSSPYAPLNTNYSGMDNAMTRSSGGVVERMMAVDFPEGRDSGQVRRGSMFWVAAELFALTGRPTYHQMLLETWDKVNTTSLTSMAMGGFGSLACLSGCKDPGRNLKESLETAFLYRADNLAAMSKRSGYRAALDGNRFVWGSNIRLLNGAMSLFIAYKISGKEEYKEAGLEQFHNICGRNPLGISYVTGFGERSVKNPRHFPSIADEVEEPLPGLLVGGPDMRRSDEYTRWLVPIGTPASKCYIDKEFSYATNDVAVSWNAMLVHALSAIGWLEDHDPTRPIPVTGRPQINSVE